MEKNLNPIKKIEFEALLFRGNGLIALRIEYSLHDIAAMIRLSVNHLISPLKHGRFLDRFFSAMRRGKTKFLIFFS